MYTLVVFERVLKVISKAFNYTGMSDENVSDDSAGEHYLSTYTHHASFHNGRDMSGKHDTLQMHSTPLRLAVPRQEARPSPER